jgi:hypothetical protein
MGAKMQHGEVFQTWRSERDATEAEMSKLLTMQLTTTPEERQIRRMRFMALVERRDVAARGLLEPVRRSTALFCAKYGPKAQQPPVQNRESQEAARPPEPSADRLPIPAATEPQTVPPIPPRIVALMQSLFS